MDFSAVETRPAVTSSLNYYNIEIKENYGLNQKTGFWWLRFTFDYEREKDIEVRLNNFKYSGSDVWTLEVVKCNYLGITCKEEMDSFDMEDELVNRQELRRLNECLGSQEKLRKYLESNILPLVVKKNQVHKIPSPVWFLPEPQVQGQAIDENLSKWSQVSGLSDVVRRRRHANGWFGRSAQGGRREMRLFRSMAESGVL